MGNSNSQHKISAQDKAILDMKNQRDTLHRYQKKISYLTEAETAAAKRCLAAGNKKRALLALRRKKYQESLLEQTDKQLEQLEKLTSSVEFALVQKDVVFGLRQGTQVLKEIQKEMGGIEEVEKLVGETEEAVAYQRELSETLAGRISNADEDEVEDELEALEAELTGVLPSVPTKELPPKERAKARERQREERERASEQEPMGEPEREAVLA